MLTRPAAAFELARRLQIGDATLGEIFAFCSGLYFRGKLAYANRFAGSPAAVQVITPSRGLLPAETAIGLREMAEFGEIEVDATNERFAGPLAEAIEEWVSAAEPGAEVLPLVMAGFSDSHWFRRAFGATVFGFCPQSAMSLAEERPLVHAADERVAVADVELMAGFFHWLPQRLLGASDG